MTTEVSELSELEQEFLGRVDERLGELQPAKDEFDRLTLTRMRLTGMTPVAASPAPSGRGRRSASNPPAASTSRGANGSQPRRKDEYLALVRDNPGITVADATERMGVQPNYIYRLRKELKAEGLITIDGAGVWAVDANNPSPERIRQLEAARAS